MRHLMVPDHVMPDYSSEIKAKEKGFHKFIGKYLEEINSKFENMMDENKNDLLDLREEL